MKKQICFATFVVLLIVFIGPRIFDYFFEYEISELKSEAISALSEYKADIDTVCFYFETYDKDDAFFVIDKKIFGLINNFMIWCNFVKEPVTDIHVLEALRRMIFGGPFSSSQLGSVSQENNCIFFRMDDHFIADISYGIVKASSVTDIYNSQGYITHVEPLNDNGWYLYIEDYERA